MTNSQWKDLDGLSVEELNIQLFHQTLNISNTIPEVNSRYNGIIVKPIGGLSQCSKCYHSFSSDYILSPGFAIQEAVMELQTTYSSHIYVNEWIVGKANYEETFSANQSKKLPIPPISFRRGHNLIRFSFSEVSSALQNAIAAKFLIKRCPVEK